ncbi:unnamed protein product [Onchocerca flexuosa]|uniref:Uncharacterized protein n=1 Tax=Onchocerca flexuosa TaxID=387005 RepID=A0A183HWL2_9BILA|nr:unnamed protein product [Onchocerca flexuosa]
MMIVQLMVIYWRLILVLMMDYSRLFLRPTFSPLSFNYAP